MMIERICRDSGVSEILTKEQFVESIPSHIVKPALFALEYGKRIADDFYFYKIAR